MPRPSLPRTGSARWRLARFVLAVLVVAVTLPLLVGGYGTGLENDLRAARDGWRAHPATGKLHIVEIDAASIAALNQWPWPRRVHARLIDRLRAAGASQILFDVDFSARSNALDDTALAAAIGRAPGKVVLPTFRQTSDWGSKGEVENLPIAPLRPSASLASVNVVPDSDGFVRTYGYGTRTAGVPRPSLAAMIAGVAGDIGSTFTIDQAIDAATIPRHSYIEMLNSDRAIAAVKGKQVLIGATAIEMGDRYAVPRQGVLPGVVVQALAAETLMQGGPILPIGGWPLFVLAALCVLGTPLLRTRGKRQAAIAWAAAVIVAAPVAGEAFAKISPDIVPALALLLLAAAANGVLDFVMTLHRARRTDPATGFPNRDALIEAARHLPSVTVVKARLTDLANVNALLSGVERRALIEQICARVAAGNGDSTVHVHGADMLAWMSPISDGIELGDSLDGLVALFRAPFAGGGRTFLVTPVFGIAEGPGRDTDNLLMSAAQAATIAAKEGLNWLRHDRALIDQSSLRLRLLAELDHAMEADQFWIAYQPKLNLKTRGFGASEALVRWAHGELGAISPGEFIPLFESEGRMHQLTLHIVRKVLDDLRAHDCRNAHGDLASVAVNISAAILCDDHFLDDLFALLAQYPAEAARLTAEVTESAAIADPKAAIAALTRLADAGIRVSIDDYGTGQSTLSYLRDFPADEIKIDQSFIRDLATDRHDQILVRSTIELAHELRFAVVAEGIEDAETLAMLESFGCDYAQGWHIGKPAPAESFFGPRPDAEQAAA